jgi:RNA 2',3'-cyclic 3'-phosphodiesterase
MRLFVALEIPAAIRAALADVASRLRAHAGRGVRWTDPAGIHLTLKFIGEVEASRLEPIQSALAGVHSPGTVEAAFRGLGWFPNPRRPRVLWAGVQASEGMPALVREIEGALEPLGIAREAREFQPHLTLARIKPEENVADLQKHAEPLGAADFGRASYTAFDLMESKLRPQGAQYTRLARFTFATAAGTSGAAA